jgi:hypothetical protein
MGDLDNCSLRDGFAEQHGDILEKKEEGVL